MKNADTDFVAIKPEKVEEFLSLSLSDKIEYTEREGIKSAVLCDVHAHDFTISMFHAYIDYYFLKPSSQNCHIYDSEAIKQTLKSMREIEWKSFNEEAKNYIAEQEGEKPDWFGVDFYPHVQSLFKYADDNDMYVVSFEDFSNLESFEDFE
ncbi:hypothetical protein [Psychrobacter sp. I-STPA10]|uniref:hypothetical protein n=1 Tax=Psychrobacter sp. I-STPA10 TaxID=2585769 RepID=UPI001E36599B|nr:hypothetical protein [Psychrobacter sp. I-STPA10]